MSHRSLGDRVRVYAVSIALLGSTLGAALWLRAEVPGPSAPAAVSLGTHDGVPAVTGGN